MQRIFPFLLLIIILFACRAKNKSEGERIIHDFDSINRSLEQLHNQIDIFDSATYKALVTRLFDDSAAGSKQLYYTLNDFHGYMTNLRWNFYKYCGDNSGQTLPRGTEDSVQLTENFIRDPHTTIHVLRGQLNEVTNDLFFFADSEQLKVELHGFRLRNLEPYDTDKEFLDTFFAGLPPVAFITILNSFEQTLKNISLKVLKDHFKK